MTPRSLMSASAAVLAALGLALLFAPDELVALTAAGRPSAPLLPLAVLQLWGAALLGLASANWTGRGLTLGGIYGRALVQGNVVHWTIGGLVALRAAWDRPAATLLWTAVVLYGAFALGFTWLLRRHPGPPERGAHFANQ